MSLQDSIYEEIKGCCISDESARHAARKVNELFNKQIAKFNSLQQLKAEMADCVKLFDSSFKNNDGHMWDIAMTKLRQLLNNCSEYLQD